MNPRQPFVHLVDDDASFLQATARLLTAHGFRIKAFDTASDLLAQVGPGTPGCVVADLHMPGMGGLELQRALIRLGVTMPFIILTGQADAAWALRARPQAAQVLVEKLAPKEQLIDAVRLALERDVTAESARMKASHSDRPR